MSRNSSKSVLVINAPNVPFTDAALLIEPIDVLTVATWIQHLGYAVVVRDLDKEQLSASEFETHLYGISPDLVVIPFDYHIPLYTGAAAAEVLVLVKLCRARNIPVVLGGRPSNTYPEYFLIDDQVTIVVGEMELALEELLACLFAKGAVEQISGLILLKSGSVIRTKPRTALLDLDRLPIPNRSLLDVGAYIEVHSMLSSRGCVERCSFCPVHQYWGRWRRRSAKLVVDEIQYLVQEFGAKKILFLDDHATVNSRRMREISTEILRRGIVVRLGCLSTVRCADVDTLALMKLAGFAWIHYGAEFADDQVLKALKKNITCDQIESAITATQELGIRVRTSWIFDAPGASAEGLERTCELILRTEPEEVRAHFLALRAGAPLHEQFASKASSGITEQYIHAAASHANPFEISSQLLEEHTARLTSSLLNRGYFAVKSASEWGKLKLENMTSANSRFISFCPGRYGIGWGAAL